MRLETVAVAAAFDDEELAQKGKVAEEAMPKASQPSSRCNSDVE